MLHISFHLIPCTDTSVKRTLGYYRGRESMIFFAFLRQTNRPYYIGVRNERLHCISFFRSRKGDLSVIESDR